jgi:hypothetical protein
VERFQTTIGKLTWRVGGTALLLIAGVAAVVWMYFAHGLAAAIVVAIPVIGVGVAAHNPWEKRPRPDLRLESNGQETCHVVLGRRRSLSVDALVADAVRMAKESAPISNALLMGAGLIYQKPTDADHAKFAGLVEAYGKEVRDWLADVDEFLRTQCLTLVARVVELNPTHTDAVDALVDLTFPISFRAVSSPPTPPDEVPVPQFPLRRSGMFGLLGPPQSPGIPGFGGHRLRASDIKALSASTYQWMPRYEESPAGLSVSWRRHAIRHGERRPVGDEFMVRCTSPGTYAVVYEIHAANQHKVRSGTWTIEVLGEVVGEPLESMQELRAHLGQLAPQEDEDEDEA